MSETLLVYRVGKEDSSTERLVDLAGRIFDLADDFEISEGVDHRTLRGKSYLIEIHTASGLVWAANEAELWKPSQMPKLLDADSAIRAAEEWLDRRGLRPALDAGFRWGSPTVGGTHYSRTRGGKRENRQLDIQVSFPVFVGDTPVTGGGADVTVILGHEGKVIGFSGGWRRAQGAFAVKVIDPAQADDEYEKLTGKLKPNRESIQRTLAYYAAPPFLEQDALYPVYVYRGAAEVGRRRMPLRQIRIPATEFGPPLPEAVPQPERPRVKRDTPSPPRVRRTLANTSASNPFAVGTSWIGSSGGLSHSQANAQGFVEEWADAGWLVSFNVGDSAAFESDWHQNDDIYVDDVDFVFYAGHADAFGWILSKPDDGALDAYEVDPAADPTGDLWGQRDLEWMIIAACGPLHDERLAAGGGDVFSRWRGAFDGLHLLMGYAAVTQDNSEEGRRVSRYAKRGSSLIDAWFRTAKEVQASNNGEQPPDGPTVYVGAMWATKNGSDPFGDRAWGFGPVSNDPSPPADYHCIWTMC